MNNIAYCVETFVFFMILYGGGLSMTVGSHNAGQKRYDATRMYCTKRDRKGLTSSEILKKGFCCSMIYDYAFTNQHTAYFNQFLNIMQNNNTKINLSLHRDALGRSS